MYIYWHTNNLLSTALYKHCTNYRSIIKCHIIHEFAYIRKHIAFLNSFVVLCNNFKIKNLYYPVHYITLTLIDSCKMVLENGDEMHEPMVCKTFIMHLMCEYAYS